MSWDDEDATWDDENVQKSDNENKPNEDLWADEDASDGEAIAGEAWDADPVEKKEEAPKPAAKKVPKKKTAKQIAKEREEQEAKDREANRTRIQVKEMTLEERKKAMDRADLALSADLFGEAPPPELETTTANADNDDMAATGVPLPVIDTKAVIDDYKLVKQPDYEKFAKEVAKKAMKANNSKYLMHFLKTMLTETSSKLNSVEFPELTKHYNIIANKKAKELSNKKVSKGGSKKQLNMNKRGDDYGDYGSSKGRGGFDSNDYDFL